MESVMDPAQHAMLVDAGFSASAAAEALRSVPAGRVDLAVDLLLDQAFLQAMPMHGSPLDVVMIDDDDDGTDYVAREDVKDRETSEPPAKPKSPKDVKQLQRSTQDAPRDFGPADGERNASSPSLSSNCTQHPTSSSSSSSSLPSVQKTSEPAKKIAAD